MLRFDKAGAFHDRAIAARLVRKIESLLGGRAMRVMHVCGTHEHVIAGNGLRALLPRNVTVISGPGCPVCVCHTADIHKALVLADQGHVIATFGDMLRVPSEHGSLQQARADGKAIHVVYAIEDAIRLAREQPGREVVFFAVGFETFAPVVAASIASDLPPNLSFLCSLKTIIPVMELLLALGDLPLDGFMTPGHVSAIIGTRPYDLFSSAYKMPVVTAGFQPNDVLLGLAMLAKQLADGHARNENEYKGIVKEGGNETALATMHAVFEETNVFWRGIGPVPGGGYTIREEHAGKDATVRFGLAKLDATGTSGNKGIPKGCSCHHVIVGRIDPGECALFRSGRCNPQDPVGPCMVSDEGTCRIAYLYKDQGGEAGGDA